MNAEKRIRPAIGETDSKNLDGLTPNPNAQRANATAARLREVDDLLEAAWSGLASGTLTVHRLREHSEWVHAIYWLGFDHGIAASATQVAQAKHEADRMALFAMNGPERGAEIQHRLDRALAACPPNIDPHSPEYFEHALAGVLRDGAA